MAAASESEILRCQLLQVRAAAEAHRLEAGLLSAEAHRLQHRLQHLTAEDGSTDDEDSMGDVERPLALPPWPPKLLALPPGSAPPPGADGPVGCPVNGPEVAAAGLPSTLLAPDAEPPCAYSCFRAGPPLVLTIINDVLTVLCHWKRSFEITNLSGCNLASQSEKRLLRDFGHSTNIMDQHAVVNFVVWRRSVLLLLLLSSCGAFVFSLFGDNWTAFSHMQDMQNISGFKVNYQQWRHQAQASLPTVDCAEIDEHFAIVLESMSQLHRVEAKTCPTLLQTGASCQDPVDSVVVGCWQPGLCQEPLMDQCPSTCTKQKLCRDTRNSNSLNYMTFTVDFAKAMLYKLIEQLSKAELQKLLFSMASKLVACGLMLGAALHWADWRRSNRLVLWAWLVTFSAPFLRSMVPTPLLIDWDPIDLRMEEYLLATDQHFDLANRMAGLAKVAGLSCHNHKLEERTQHSWDTAHHKVHWWCGKVQWGAKWFPWSNMLQKGAQQCQVLNDYMGVGDVATVKARTEKQRLCSVINTTHVKEEPLSGIREIVDVGWLRSAVYTLIGGLSSLLSFRVVLPEALSVAPGLLTAAIRLKVVVPQSYLPGVFIAIMPLLYVPTVWSFCIFGVQGMGDPLLLVAFVLLAFTPLAYTVLGFAKQVTSPMSRNRARAFATLMKRVTSLMQLVAFVCLLIYAVKVFMHLHHIQESRKGIAAFLLEQGQRLVLPLLVGQADNLVSLLLSGPLWSLVFTFWTELYMTAIVGADWMMRASAEEWDSQGEECFVELQEENRMNRSGAEELLRQRRNAMEAILELTTNRRHAEGH